MTRQDNKTMELNQRPSLRIRATELWVGQYLRLYPLGRDTKNETERALLVLVLDETIRSWLVVNDYQALAQAQRAIMGMDYTDFLNLANKEHRQKGD